MTPKKLVEVCITEPAKSTFSDIAPNLNSLFNYPARLRISNWWMNDDGSVTPVGGQGKWYPDHRGNFTYDGHNAHVVGEIATRRYLETDRFVETSEDTPPLSHYDRGKNDDVQR